MSNYVKATNFYSKDALLSGNPDKIIRGSEIDAEYNAIATAISTKADLNSPTFTGTPSASTAAAGNNTTQLATTAFVTTAVSGLSNTLGTMSVQNYNAVSITGGTIVGITDLTVADGGTGGSTFTANSVVLGNGTNPLNGNMVAPGTSGNLLQSNGTTWASTPNQYLGVGQTWQLPTRVIGTSYQNTTGKPIMVSLSIYDQSGGPGMAVCTIQVSSDNSTWITIGATTCQSDDDTNKSNFSFVVPNNLYYKAINTNKNPGIQYWSELR